MNPAEVDRALRIYASVIDAAEYYSPVQTVAAHIAPGDFVEKLEAELARRHLLIVASDPQALPRIFGTADIREPIGGRVREILHGIWGLLRHQPQFDEGAFSDVASKVVQLGRDLDDRSTTSLGYPGDIRAAEAVRWFLRRGVRVVDDAGVMDEWKYSGDDVRQLQAAITTK